MRIPWLRQRVTPGVREAIDLLPGERVLATAKSGESGFLVATTSALSLVVSGSDPISEQFALVWRIRWDQIDNARWEAPELSMKVRADGSGAAVEVQQVQVDKTADLPAVVRDRVSESIIASEEIVVEGGSVRAVARRHGDSTETIWRVSVGAGVDAGDPEVRRQAEEGLAALRSRLGV